MSLYTELKRRNVFRVAAAYLVVGWLLLQVSDVVLGFVGAPEWVGKALIALLLLGLVPSVAIAWIYEVGPHGVHRDDGQANPAAGTHARRLDYITLFALVAVALLVLVEQARVRAKGPAAEDAAAAGADATGKATVPAVAPVPPVPRASVAVLPFTKMSPDPENEYFADGIAEELLNVLSGVESLKVASRTSAFSFKGKQTAVDEIARSLKVAHILQGSVRKQGNQVRITAQLIDAATDQNLWSNSYDRELDDIFSLQEEIARAISLALSDALGVTGAARRIEVDAPTKDLHAYELYLKGRERFHQRGDALIPARRLLEEAVAADPEFAEAWAVLAAARAVSPNYVSGSRPEAYEAAAEAAERARALDDGLALPYAVLGRIAVSRSQLLEAERLFGEALRRDPRDSTTWLWRGIHFQLVGKLAKAEEDLRRAIEIDPLTGIAHTWLAAILSLQGDQTAAERALERAHELGYSAAGWVQARFALSRGNRDDAIESLRYLYERYPDLAPTSRAVIDAIFAAIADSSKAPELYAAVRADPVGLNDTGWSSMLAMLGMHREALAVELDPNLPRDTYYFHREVWFPAARKILADPDFMAIAERDGFIEYWNEMGMPDGCRVREAPPRQLDCTERWK